MTPWLQPYVPDMGDPEEDEDEFDEDGEADDEDEEDDEEDEEEEGWRVRPAAPSDGPSVSDRAVCLSLS